MRTKQTIAIIGLGSMGKGLATALARGTDRVLLFDRKEAEAAMFANQLAQVHPGYDVEAINCSANACWEADIIIPAIPYTAQAEVAGYVKQYANQKVVISIANPMGANGADMSPETSAAEELQQLLPYSKVVKAFNTTYASLFAQPLVNSKTVDCFIAGNDADAIQTVTDLVETVGFNPVLAGDLTKSRTLEAMQLLLIQLTMRNNYDWHAGWKVLHN